MSTATTGDTLAPLPIPAAPTPADLLLADTLFPADDFGLLF